MAHRRRGVGVGKVGPRYNKKAEEMKAISAKSAMETVKQLEVKLTEFAKKHQNEIQNDPVFRIKFLEMCGPLGVDPLSSKKSFWGNLIGIGEFYYELAIKVAEVCIASRSRNGGMISVKEVRNILVQRGTKFKFSSSHPNSGGNGGKAYSEQDIITSISKLSILGSGFRTISVGKSVMIVSVPMELDNDHMTIMNVAQEIESFNDCYGSVTIQLIEDKTSWKEERINRALEILLRQGMVWLDVDEVGVKRYWFPSLWKQVVAGYHFS